ncbi:phosphoribosyltransferase-like protein [Acidimangrovimonas sediminis]|uniref:phosphoribosyltransferase-like protein n=1 Tax=Acidimangrovimonas sediminis TaxID=2056283 RepID=UPI0011AF85AB|nr:hypothetical protein [Acidimangrovimonas sediminis]
MVERSNEIMSMPNFAEILRLAMKSQWLEKKSNAINEIFGLCVTPEQKSLVTNLIERFHYATPNDQLQYRRAIAFHIVQTLKVSPENSIIIALNDRELADSSSSYVQQMKGVLAEYDGWKSGNFVDKLISAVSAAEDGKSIIIVDDFAGSGDTISKKSAWLRQKLEGCGKDCNIFVAVASAMESSMDKVVPLVKDYYAVNWLRKGLTDFYDGEDAVSMSLAMEQLEEKLKKRSNGKSINDYSFGWKRSEATYFLEGDNPPNNNFPIFWWPELKGGVKRNRLTPRI